MLSYILEHHRYLNILGIFVIIAVAYIASTRRKAVSWRLVTTALAMQFGIAFCMLKLPLGVKLVGKLAEGIAALYQFAEHGARFVFGSLVDASGPWGFLFAFKVLPIIIFFGALMSILFYIGFVQKFVAGINMLVRPLLGTSGPESVCAVANSFLGQTEAPMLIKHYLASMSRSEIFVVMVSGMATISGSILAVFAAMGVPAAHMLTASVMAVPASILIAKMMIPGDNAGHEQETVCPTVPQGNLLDALATGTFDGLSLALNVAAMLIVFIALIAMGDKLVLMLTSSLHTYIAAIIPVIDLRGIFGYLFAPVAMLLGFVGDQSLIAGQLLGTKMVVNELVAYQDMLTKNLDERSIAILTYALCGFANFSCIGIQIGGIGALCGAQRPTLTQLGVRAVFAATLVNLLSACIVGLLL